MSEYQDKLKAILEARGLSLRAWCFDVLMPYQSAYKLLKEGAPIRSKRNMACIDREYVKFVGGRNDNNEQA